MKDGLHGHKHLIILGKIKGGGAKEGEHIDRSTNSSIKNAFPSLL